MHTMCKTRKKAVLASSYLIFQLGDYKPDMRIYWNFKAYDIMPMLHFNLTGFFRDTIFFPFYFIG